MPWVDADITKPNTEGVRESSDEDLQTLSGFEVIALHNPSLKPQVQASSRIERATEKRPVGEVACPCCFVFVRAVSWFVINSL